MVKIVNGNIIQETIQSPSTGVASKRRHSLSSIGDFRKRDYYPHVPKEPWGNNPTGLNHSTNQLNHTNNNSFHNSGHHQHSRYQPHPLDSKSTSNLHHSFPSEEETLFQNLKRKFSPLRQRAVLYGFEVQVGYIFLGTHFNRHFHDQMVHNYPVQEEYHTNTEQSSSNMRNNSPPNTSPIPKTHRRRGSFTTLADLNIQQNTTPYYNY